jgi:hypothetical protein
LRINMFNHPSASQGGWVQKQQTTCEPAVFQSYLPEPSVVLRLQTQRSALLPFLNFPARYAGSDVDLSYRKRQRSVLGSSIHFPFRRRDLMPSLKQRHQMQN